MRESVRATKKEETGSTRREIMRDSQRESEREAERARESNRKATDEQELEIETARRT